MDAHKKHSVTFTINGQASTLQVTANSLSLNDLLDILEVKPEMVALEVDEQVIPRDSWAEFMVGPSNRIEIMKFVGGG